MEKSELLKKLIKLNIHPKFYSIGEEIKDNAENIEKRSNGSFLVYYLERGEKNNLKIFGSEEEALEELIHRLKINLDYGLDLSQ
jgi:hypothetical protein